MDAVSLHEMIEDELYEKHSISALVTLITAGRELDFVYDSVDYSITNSKDRVMLNGAK